MKKIKDLLLRIFQNFTYSVQLKGIPKLIIISKGFFFNKEETYKSYNNLILKVDPTVNFHCLNILNYGGYDSIKLFEKYLKKGDVYIDIGTNFGYMALNAERIVGKEGKVIGFEPDTEILPLLKSNIALNNSSITIIEKALSEKEGIAMFNIATESGLSRLDNIEQNLSGLDLLKKNEVQTDTLDHVLNGMISSRPVNFIKIDVEGHELSVLKGAVKTINNFRPTFLMEINHGALSQNKVSYKDILDFFRPFSYKFYYVDSHSADWLRFNRNPSIRELESYSDEFLESKPFDLLCHFPEKS